MKNKFKYVLIYKILENFLIRKRKNRILKKVFRTTFYKNH